MHFIGWRSFPVALAIAALACEALARLLRKRLGLEAQELVGLLLRTLRPWLAWALLSIVFRSWPELAFNEPETFPFYADPWDPDTPLLDRARDLASRPAFWTSMAAACSLLSVMCLSGVSLLRRSFTSGRVAAWGPPLLCLLTLTFTLAVNTLPSGFCFARSSQSDSFLRSWHNRSATLLPAARKIKSTRDHFDRFLEYQSQLGVHGHSHPPGASLSLYWIGRAASFGRATSVYHYALGLAVLASLGGLIVYQLGRRLFSPKVGVCAVMLWGLAPSTVIYGVFAQESFYSLFFNLALLCMWMTSVAERPWRWGALLGITFVCLSMLSYSWSVAMAMFAVFAFWDGRLRRRSALNVVLRVAWPCFVFLTFFGATLAILRLDYLTMYRNAYSYVMDFYPLSGLYQHMMALLGGQLGVLLMMGSLCASLFVASVKQSCGDRKRRHVNAFLFSVLSVYMLPLLMVPAVRVEAPRQWNWIATLPIVTAASLAWADDRFRWPRLLGACVVSGLTAILLRVFLVFWG